MPIAELNIAKLKKPLDHPDTAGFTRNLERINALAEQSPGFVWRLTGEGSDATDLRFGDDPNVIVNLSVWETAKHLEHYVFGTLHNHFYQNRSLWFEVMDKPQMVFWHVEPGQEPSLAEAHERLQYFQINGPTDFAFGWAEVMDVERMRSLRCA